MEVVVRVAGGREEDGPESFLSTEAVLVLRGWELGTKSPQQSLLSSELNFCLSRSVLVIVNRFCFHL